MIGMIIMFLINIILRTLEKIMTTLTAMLLFATILLVCFAINKHNITSSTKKTGN